MLHSAQQHSKFLVKNVSCLLHPWDLPQDSGGWIPAEALAGECSASAEKLGHALTPDLDLPGAGPAVPPPVVLLLSLAWSALLYSRSHSDHFCRV